MPPPLLLRTDRQEERGVVRLQAQEEEQKLSAAALIKFLDEEVGPLPLRRLLKCR